MAKVHANSVIQRFRSGVNAFARSRQHIRDEKWALGEEELKRAVIDMADSLEQAFKLHLRNLGHAGRLDEADRQKLRQPNFQVLVSMFQKYGDPPLPAETQSSLYAYREARNEASHNDTVPSIELAKDMSERLPPFLAFLLDLHEEPALGEQVGAGSAVQPKLPKAVRVVGRNQELENARRLIDGVLSDRIGALITVTGMSGVGKTHFCRVLCSYAADSGMQVVATACEPFQDGVELFPVRDFLRQVAGHSSASTLVREYFPLHSMQVALAELAESHGVHL